MKEYGTKVQVTDKNSSSKTAIKVLKTYMQGIMPYSLYKKCPVIIVRHPVVSAEPYRCDYSVKSFTPESEFDALRGEAGGIFTKPVDKVLWFNKPAQKIVSFWRNK